MCGIIGYVGPRECEWVLVDGLRKLEYRGYDSAGLALVSGGNIEVRRAAGKLDNLAKVILAEPASGNLGIGHTRWATHGPPTELNAHPHRVGGIAVVHNGIIENHRALKQTLEANGAVFSSETDTEIVAHLVYRERAAGHALAEAVRRALTHVEGAYALAIIDATTPGTLVAARKASPLVLGIGEGEHFVASDVPAILSHTRRVAFMDEDQMAVLTAEGIELSGLESGEPIELVSEVVSWTPAMAEKGGYEHFMLKEIHEQPRAVADTLRGRLRIEHADVDVSELGISDEELAAFERVVVLACGTSWHAGLVGEYLFERFARIPVEVELSSEFRYRYPVIDDKCLVIAISQSGETADTIAAMRESRVRGARVIALCNVVGSTVTRLAHGTLFTHAGPEVSVASTKAFTTQLSGLMLLALKMARVRKTVDVDEMAMLLQALIEVPAKMEEVLKTDDSVWIDVAKEYYQARSMLYLGRGLNYPLALEGALKLKEISYVHAEGYAAGEMKHGPIALVDEDLPTLVVCPEGDHFDKTMANVQEIKARGGPVIGLTTAGEPAKHLREIADVVLTIPEVEEHVQPLVASIPLQLLAYHIARFKGTDVDQPRNLAKSVTVE